MRHRKLHEQYKPEAQASEYCGLFTRLRFGLVLLQVFALSFALVQLHRNSGRS